MSSQLSAAPREALSSRQVQVLDRLLSAAMEELEAVGHDALTIRSVAQRAELSPATAYTYLASKDHLFAELFWRRLREQSPLAPDAPPPGTARVLATVQQLTDLIAASPTLAAAATRSLLGSDLQVARIRQRIGALIVERLAAAMGLPEQADVVLEALSLTFFGALLHAGTGQLPYEQIGERLSAVITLIMEGPA